MRGTRICKCIAIVTIVFVANIAAQASTLLKEVKINNFNTDPVIAGPVNPSRIRIKKQACILELRTYHYNQGRGVAPGFISIESEDARVLGKWQADSCPAKPVGSKSELPGLFWRCRPDRILKPGTYLIRTSDPSSWSCNAKNQKRGFYAITLSAEPEASLPPENPNPHGIPVNLKETDFAGSYDEFWDYLNMKFDFSIRYPCALIMQGESPDGNGQEFKSRDGSACLRTFGELQEGAKLEAVLKSTIKEKQDAGEEILYKRVSDDWFIISSKRGQWYLLTKVIVKNSQVLTFQLSYTDARSKIFSGLDRRMAASFKKANQSTFDPVADAKRVVVLPPASGKTTPRTYRKVENTDFCFAAEFPVDFRQVNDNPSFEDSSKQVLISTSASEAEDAESGTPLDLDYLYAEETHFAPDRRVLHKERNSDSIVIVSVDTENKVNYKRTILGKSAQGVRYFKELSVSYPLNMHSTLLPMLKHVTASLHNI